VSHPPGFLIAATRSGAGKTTLTMGLLRAFRRRGLRVGSAKCGPDYIDPGMHALATAQSSVNLDSWAMRPALLEALRAHVEADTELLVCEGVMGLFDGRPNSSPEADGSSASIAARMGWPVVLVVDVSGQAQSVAAVVKGFAEFRRDVRIAGVILNRIASPRHLASCQNAIEGTGLRVLGALPTDQGVKLTERHLGLVQALDTDEPDRLLDALAAFVENHVDLDALLRVAREATSGSAGRGVDAGLLRLKPPGQRIALAHDRAFSFVYPHLLTAWRRAGAEIVPFSPLSDQAPDARADVCWLPGGYPELHVETLAHARNFLEGTRSFARTRPVHGECGGYMVLGETLVDAHGARHSMLGLLGHSTSFEKRRLSLGYREARLSTSGVLGAAGTWLRGHEFHYASLLGRGQDELLFDRAEGTTEACFGTRRGSVSGSFFHFLDTKD
jgi:cobyrinic acid a,c-diamide synthase